MTELSKVTSVEVVDFLGRSHVSHDAEHFTFTLDDDGRTLRIVHDGDTRYRQQPARQNTSRPTVEEVTGIFSDHWPDDMSPEEYIRKERDGR